jgi:hypothetical protein
MKWLMLACSAFADTDRPVPPELAVKYWRERAMQLALTIELQKADVAVIEARRKADEFCGKDYIVSDSPEGLKCVSKKADSQ